MKSFLRKPLMLFVVLALGIASAVVIVKNRKPLGHEDMAMQPRSVQVMTVDRIPFRAAVTAYGNVEPSVLLEVKTELNGKVSYLHPDVRQGGSLARETLVARIDPEDYEVTLKQTQADLAANESTLAQLVEEEANLGRSLELAKKNLEIGEKDFERFRDTWKKGVVSSSQLGAEEQKVIQLRQTVDDLQGQLNTFASRKAVVEAQIARSREQVRSQKTLLQRTEIRIPFDARVGEVKVEQGEFVTTGSILFEALDIGGVEISAQLPVSRMRGLVGALNGRQMNLDVASMHGMLESLGLDARVRLVGDSWNTDWEGRVARFSEAVDPVRRTLGVVVAVDKPYEKVIPGKRPPLIKGMYVAVDLTAPATDEIVIPRKAMHEGRVYVADADNRLAIRPVVPRLVQGDLVVVESGLVEDERIVLNDIVPVIEGMPLQPEPDEAYLAEFRSRAGGETR